MENNQQQNQEIEKELPIETVYRRINRRCRFCGHRFLLQKRRILRPIDKEIFCEYCNRRQ